MKVAIYQTNPELLNLKANLEDIIAKIHEGKEKGYQLMVFPELALTGYLVGERYHTVALRMDSTEVRKLTSATKGTAAVVGFIEESPSMNFYNSALVAVNGESLFAYRKLNLPNYGVFEERKYFAPGKRVPVFQLYDFNLAVFVCNDLWHPSLPYLSVCQKADLFITLINSTEESMGEEFSNMETWRIINTFYARVFGIYHMNANRVGEESLIERRNIPNEVEKPANTGDQYCPTMETKNYRFWGGSEIINPFGKPIAKAALYEPDEISAEISRNLLRRKKILLPYLRNDDPYFTHRELQRILYSEKWAEKTC